MQKELIYTDIDFKKLEDNLNFHIDENLRAIFNMQLNSYQNGFNHLNSIKFPNDLIPTDFGANTSFANLRKDIPENVNPKKVYESSTNQKDHFVVIE